APGAATACVDPRRQAADPLHRGLYDELFLGRVQRLPPARRGLPRLRRACRGFSGRPGFTMSEGMRRSLMTTDTGGEVTFASYNIHKCVGIDGRYDPDRVGAVIAEINPDVIALQEVDSRFGKRA